VKATASDQTLAAKLSKREAINIEKEKRDNDAQDEQFNIYFERTKTEYDQSRIDAVEKCTKLMRTDEQVGQMIELIRPMARQLDTLPVQSETWQKKEQLVRGLLHKLPLQKTLEIIEQEIEHGNQGSLRVCAAWIRGDSLSLGRRMDVHLKKIKQGVPALCSMITGRYDEPGIMPILNGLAGAYGVRAKRKPEIHEAIVDEIVKQGVPELLKRKVLTGKLDFRISASLAIRMLLRDDLEVYQISAIPKFSFYRAVSDVTAITKACPQRLTFLSFGKTGSKVPRQTCELQDKWCGPIGY